MTRAEFPVPRLELEKVFEDAEFAQRIGKAQKAMADRGLTGLLLTSLHSLYYLFGYERTVSNGLLQAVLLPTTGEAVAVIRNVNYVLARQSAFLQEVHLYSDASGGAVETLVRVIAERQDLSSAHIGLELEHTAIPPKMAEAVATRLRAERVELSDASSLVTTLRLYKSPAEVAKMRRAGEILDIQYEAAFAAMRPGARECDVAAAALHAAYSAGGDYCILPPLLSSGINTLVCTHLPPTRRVLQVGDPIVMESGASFQRYHAVASHSAVCGAKPTAEMASHYRQARQIVDAGRAMIGPGVATAEVARTMQALRRDDTQQYRAGNQSGYATGVAFQDQWYENMSIQKADTFVLAEGMTFTLFGSYLHDDRYVMHTVDPVVITASGFDDLSQLPRDDLRVVGA